MCRTYTTDTIFTQWQRHKGINRRLHKSNISRIHHSLLSSQWMFSIWCLNNSICSQSSWLCTEYLFNKRLLARHVSSVYCYLFIVGIVAAYNTKTFVSLQQLYLSIEYNPAKQETWPGLSLCETHMQAHSCTHRPTSCSEIIKTACLVTASGFSCATHEFMFSCYITEAIQSQK